MTLKTRILKIIYHKPSGASNWIEPGLLKRTLAKLLQHFCKERLEKQGVVSHIEDLNDIISLMTLSFFCKRYLHKNVLFHIKNFWLFYWDMKGHWDSLNYFFGRTMFHLNTV